MAFQPLDTRGAYDGWQKSVGNALAEELDQRRAVRRAEEMRRMQDEYDWINTVNRAPMQGYINLSHKQPLLDFLNNQARDNDEFYYRKKRERADEERDLAIERLGALKDSYGVYPDRKNAEVLNRYKIDNFSLPEDTTVQDAQAAMYKAKALGGGYGGDPKFLTSLLELREKYRTDFMDYVKKLNLPAEQRGAISKFLFGGLNQEDINSENMKFLLNDPKLSGLFSELKELNYLIYNQPQLAGYNVRPKDSAATQNIKNKIRSLGNDSAIKDTAIIPDENSSSLPKAIKPNESVFSSANQNKAIMNNAAEINSNPVDKAFLFSILNPSLEQNNIPKGVIDNYISSGVNPNPSISDARSFLPSKEMMTLWALDLLNKEFGISR